MSKLKGIGWLLLGVVMFVVLCAMSFGITAALVYGICWSLDFEFSMKVTFGIWLIMFLIHSVIRR